MYISCSFQWGNFCLGVGHSQFFHFFRYYQYFLCFFQWGNFCLGGEDGRHAGWSSSDPARRRNTGPIANDGNLSRQKAPVPSDSNGSKEVMVSIFIYGTTYDQVSLVESYMMMFYFINNIKHTTFLITLCLRRCISKWKRNYEAALFCFFSSGHN